MKNRHFSSSIILAVIMMFLIAASTGGAAAFLNDGDDLMLLSAVGVNAVIGIFLFLFLQSVFCRTHKEIKESFNGRDLGHLEILNIVNSAASNLELEESLEALLPKLLETLNSNWAAFYLANNATNKLEIRANVGFSKNIYSEFDLTIGEGFVGMAALKRETVVIKDIPDDTVYITKNFLGSVKPKNLMMVPLINRDSLLGVLALGSIYEYTQNELELVDLLKYYVGATIENGIVYERSKRLTNELKFQNKLIQDLNNELETKINQCNVFLGGIIDSIKDYAIYALDTTGTVIMWNKGAELMFGYSSEEIMGKNIQMIYPAEDVESGLVKRCIERVLTEGRFADDCLRIRRDGSAYRVHISSSALYDEDGQIMGMANITCEI